MLQLYTKVDIPKTDFYIDLETKLYFTGSCFAENIGNRFKQLKLQICVNPFGVQYNPLAICKSLQMLLTKDCFTKDDLRFENELWFSFSHYTYFSDISPQSCLEKINSSFASAKEYIQNAKLIIITVGTSWTYILKEDNQVVSNCHKLPASRFDRIFTEIDESVNAFSNAIQLVRKVNPDSRFLFTVSPIRHWKDGAIENQRSKAALLLAISKLQKEVKDVYYFPSYEIMMDELRDYRFYNSDMIHPSEQATEYIQERFIQTYFDDESQKALTEIKRVIASLSHRPIHKSTHSYKKFISSLLVDIENLIDKNPFLNFNSEISELKNFVHQDK